MENHIIIGLGGTGGKVLKAFRKRLWSEFGEDERTKLPIGFVYVDSTTEMMNPDDVTWRVQGENAVFTNREFVNIKGVELSTILKNPNGFPGVKGFLGDPEVMGKTIGDIKEAAGQKRRAGRILFGGSVSSYLSTLGAQYSKVKEISGNTALNVHIITGLAGGTGSGSIIDVIAQTRTLFPASKKDQGANILVYTMIPEVHPPAGCEAGRYHPNGYAALVELNALNAGKYLPHDVTGQKTDAKGEVKRIANNGTDGIFLYTNVNEHGKVIESFQQLPAIVSDLLYSYIFLEQNNNTNDFMRSYSFENIDQFKLELNEKAKDGEIDVVRSKAFGSFGVKRVIIPEEEIIEFFTYKFARQALLQIRYNNWNDDLGYRDKPANVDFNSFVSDAQQLERWRMTDKHLTLDKPILASDEKKWPGFADYWSNVIPQWTMQASTTKLPLNELSKLCSEVGYEKGFRRLGVRNFFEGKLQAKEDHANEIVDHIEKYLFDQWGAGELSLYNLTMLIDKLAESVGKRRKDYEGKITDANKSLEQLTLAINSLLNEWAGLGLIGNLVRRNKIIQGHSTLMIQLYLKKTEIEGLNFGKELLAALFIKLNTLRGRVETFVKTVNEAIDDAEKQAGARCQDEGNATDLQEAVIRFYNYDAVVKFAKEVERDKKRQENIASEFRQALLAQIGSERSFVRANAEINNDKISQIIDTLVREKSVSIHDEILIENNEKLINRNILEQLSEKYRSEEDLRKFAVDLIQKSGVLLTFDQTEINRAIKNNENPIVGVNIFRKVLVINLPKIEGNENVQNFADRFKNALINSVDGSVIVKVDTTGSRKNEITIISLTYCFPLRAIQDLKFLKEKYDYLLTNPNVVRQNQTLLHTEGTGGNFPSLFVENDLLPSQIREKYTAYLIMAYAMGLIKYADKADGTGKSAYGTITKDELGDEVLNPLADKFTEIPFVAAFDESFGESLRELTEKTLKSDYLHISKREELVTKTQELYSKIIVPEFGGNKGTAECKFFADQAKEAIRIIKSK